MFALTRRLATILFAVSLIRLMPAAGTNTEEPARVFFSRTGYAPFNTKYAVVVLPFNITFVVQHLAKIRGALTSFAERKVDLNLNPQAHRQGNAGNMFNWAANATHQHPATFYSADLRAQQLTNRAEHIRQLFSSVDTVLDRHVLSDPSAHTDFTVRHRQKRFPIMTSLLAAGLVAVIAASIASIWSSSEITSMTGMEATVQRLASQSADNAHDGINLGFTEHEIATVVANIIKGMDAENAQWHAPQLAHHALDIVEERLDMIDLAIDSAAHGHLNTRALLQIDLGKTAVAVTRQARALGYEPHSNHFSDWLQYPTDFRATDEGFEVLLHIPLVQEDRLLSIYRHHPLPIPLEDGLHLSITPADYTHVAITPDLQYFQALTTADLNTCARMGDLFLCDQISVLRRAPPPSAPFPNKDPAICIYALAARFFPLATATCNTHLTSSEAALTMVAPTQFAAYSSEPSTARTACPNASRVEHTNFEGLQLLTLPLGCSGETGDFVYASADPSFTRNTADWTISYSWPLTISELTENLSTDQLDDLMLQARAVLNSTSEISVQAALRAAGARADRTLATAHYHHAWATPSLALLIAIAGLALSLYNWRLTRTPSCPIPTTRLIHGGGAVEVH